MEECKMLGARSNPNPFRAPNMFDDGIIVLPKDDGIIFKKHTRVDKIKNLIRECIKYGVEIPAEWVEEYNNQCNVDNE
jgi:hypothetical protein